MKNKVILYAAASLDGMIAGKNDDLKWLDDVPPDPDGDYGYSDLLKRCGTIIMGRRTYEVVQGLSAEWPYTGKDSFIMTHNAAFSPATPDTFVCTGDPVQFVADRFQKTSKDIWLVGGGNLIRSFLELDLVDEIILTLIPKILGGGIPYFPTGMKSSQWHLESSRSYPGGVVILTYSRSI